MVTSILRRIAALALLAMVAWTGFAYAYDTETVTGIDFGDYGQQAYVYLQYIDSNLPDRDSDGGKDTADAQEWIIRELKAAGFADNRIEKQAVSFETESGKRRATQNIVATLAGQTGKQIIIGAHYDAGDEGNGTGDNGSGVALLLETACRLVRQQPRTDTLVFVFFGAEEYDLDGSAAYARSMTKREVADTRFMINLDSLVCGDFCYLYGGVADFENRRVEKLDAFELVYAVSLRLGLNLHVIPWTFDRPAPGFREPDYPSPSAGDWSDHVAFAERGIPYVYLEASNWEIPGPDRQYDGDSETAEAGKFMHTARDTLARLEELYPGRALYHLQVFSLLLNAVLTDPVS